MNKTYYLNMDLFRYLMLVLFLPKLVMTRVISETYEKNVSDCVYYTEDNSLHVDCSSLGLSELPAGLNSEVSSLDLSNNNLVTFPDLRNFTRLENIFLSANSINSLQPDYFINMPELNSVDFSNNNFDSWSKIEFGPKLTSLDLSRNKINSIDDDAFEDLIALQKLDLTENRLFGLSESLFSNNSNLETLKLSRNYFSIIPRFKSNSLRRLDLSNCQISVLNSTDLQEMPSILDVNLSLNEIESIPDNFASGTLQDLNLSFNSISTLNDYTLSSLPHLAVLDLRGNDFKDIWSPSYFSSNPFLSVIKVKGNRWNCNGFELDLLLTYDFLTKEPSKVEDTSSLICYLPSNVTQLTWQEAYLRTWHADKSQGTYYTWAAVFIGIIIGIVLTSVICRGLTSFNGDDPIPVQQPLSISNGTLIHEGTTRVESVVLRLTEDLPPSYDEALLMPTLGSSFQSLPNILDERCFRESSRRRSRSYGDIVEARPHTSGRRSMRPHRTVEINIA